MRGNIRKAGRGRRPPRLPQCGFIYGHEYGYADSEEQVVSLYDAMISEIDANQASAIEAVYTEKYNEQLALWK